MNMKKNQELKVMMLKMTFNLADDDDTNDDTNNDTNDDANDDANDDTNDDKNDVIPVQADLEGSE